MQESKTMKAAFLTGPKQIQVKDIPIPKPQKGQVLIKVIAAPINPSDVELYNGNYSHQKKFPTVMGFEGSGIVVESGGGLMGWSIMGKKVAFAVELEGQGSYSQYALAKADQCLPLEDGTSFEEGSMSLINPLTALAFLDILKSNKQKSVVITAAASALGKMMNRYFPKEGIEVINIVRRQEQVELLKEEGAKYVINSSDQNFQNELKQITHKLGTLTCLQAIGGKISGVILRNMPKNSKVTIYGCLSHENVQDIGVFDLLVDNKSVNGFLLVNWLKTKSQLGLLSTFYKIRKTITTNLKSQIAKKYNVQKTQEAIDHYLKHMTEGKVIIKPWGEE